MIDFHTHVLPALDDGSRSPEESAAMLLRLAEQGITAVVATPHFYAGRDHVSAFLERRSQAIAKLQAVYDPTTMPILYGGAEVHYFPGMGSSEAVRSLTIAGTKLLLLELPFGDWNHQMLADLQQIETHLGLRIILAHLERYRSAKNAPYLRQLLAMGMLIQTNCEAMLSFSTRGWVLRQLAAGNIQLLGSDCHNMTQRVPNWDRALPVVEKKLGKAFCEQNRLFSENLLSQAERICFI